MRIETYTVRGVIRAYTGSIEQEPHSSHLFPLTITESIHKLLQWSRPLDLEKDLVVVVRDLNVKVLRRGSRFSSVRHIGFCY